MMIHTMALLVVAAVTHAAAAEITACDGIAAFVQPVYIHGLPMREALRFQAPTCTVRLVELLHDSGMEHQRSTVVLTLGLTGNQAAIAPLIAFLETPAAAALTRAEYVARTNVLLALGYLAAVTTDTRAQQEATAYLERHLSPTSWDEVTLPSPFDADLKGRNLYLTTKAMQGLGVSGTRAGRLALTRLQDILRACGRSAVKHLSPRDAALAHAWQRLRQPVATIADIERILRDCLRANEVIMRDGLAAYYD